MEPSIEIYNQFIHDDTPILQQELQKVAPGAFFEASYDNYAQLIETLGQLKPELTIDDLYTAPSHSEILDAINGKWNIQRPFIIWNIDHHHDCGYENENTELDEILKRQPGCAVWVQHLIATNPNFQGYVWISNRNSNREIKPQYKRTIPPLFVATNDISIIGSVQFDKVFICESPGWVPERYYPLTKSLLYLFEKYIKK